MSGAVLIASLALLWFLTTGPVAAPALWGLALLLAVLNAAIFIESAATGLSMLSLTGSAVSWVVLLFWWMRAAGSVGVMPSLLVVVGLTLIMLTGHAWVHRRGTQPSAGQLPFASGMWLALAGHLFAQLDLESERIAVTRHFLFGAVSGIGAFQYQGLETFRADRDALNTVGRFAGLDLRDGAQNNYLY